MATSRKLNNKPQKSPRFWVGPLLASCFFSIGYGVMHRLIIQINLWGKQSEVVFNDKPFPGTPLKIVKEKIDREKKKSHYKISGKLESSIKNQQALLDVSNHPEKIPNEKKLMVGKEESKIKAQNISTKKLDNFGNLPNKPPNQKKFRRSLTSRNETKLLPTFNHDWISHKYSIFNQSKFYPLTSFPPINSNDQ